MGRGIRRVERGADAARGSGGDKKKKRRYAEAHDQRALATRVPVCRNVIDDGKALSMRQELLFDPETRLAKTTDCATAATGHS
jgi:hypothetical protein